MRYLLPLFPAPPALAHDGALLPVLAMTRINLVVRR